MLKQIDCDIFEAPIDILIHGCNCFHTMGGGLALEVRHRFPEAYEADCKTKIADRNKLSTHSFAYVKHISPMANLKVINLYTQFNYGMHCRMTSYDAIAYGLENLINHGGLTHKNLAKGGATVGIPYMLGCGLGVGSWAIVEPIIYHTMKDYPGDVLICKKP